MNPRKRRRWSRILSAITHMCHKARCECGHEVFINETIRAEKKLLDEIWAAMIAANEMGLQGKELEKSNEL